MRRLLDIGPGSPLGRWTHRMSRGRLTPRALRIATFTLGLGFALFMVAVLFMVQVSSTPRFCGSCHIMEPYYASWKHSKHNQVCIQERRSLC